MTTSPQTRPPSLRLSLPQILRKPDTEFKTPAAKASRQRVKTIWHKAMLWTFIGWLAMFYAGAGIAKLSEPMDNLIFLMGWPAQVPVQMVRALGLVDLVLAALLLTPATGLKASRTVIMSVTAVLMAFQAAYLIFHLIALDTGLAAINLILLALTATVFAGYRRSH